MANHFYNDLGLTTYVQGIVILALQLKWSEDYTARHIMKYYTGANATRVRLLTKHYYRYPPETRQVA